MNTKLRKAGEATIHMMMRPMRKRPTKKWNMSGDYAFENCDNYEGGCRNSVLREPPPARRNSNRRLLHSSFCLGTERR
jgi:hypothetical protein